MSLEHINGIQLFSFESVGNLLLRNNLKLEEKLQEEYKEQPHALYLDA